MEPTTQSPGTVSRILWHFTGGPAWNESKRRQHSSPKPAAQAFQNLKSILQSRQLRLGGYKEAIRVRSAERRKFNPATRKAEVHRNVIEELTSSPVCCVADVPIIHLSYLASRYGKFAIGFHRDAVVRHGFNPVFYALDDANSILAIYHSLRQLGNISGELFKLCGDFLEESIEEFLPTQGLEESPDLQFVGVIKEQSGVLDESVQDVRSRFEDFLGFVKTFSADEFSSIYCEREWRALVEFEFTYDDVAMVVMPRRVGKNTYFHCCPR